MLPPVWLGEPTKEAEKGGIDMPCGSAMGPQLLSAGSFGSSITSSV